MQYNDLSALCISNVFFLGKLWDNDNLCPQLTRPALLDDCIFLAEVGGAILFRDIVFADHIFETN